MRRRSFLTAGSAALATSMYPSSVLYGADSSPIRIGLVADPQYADIETWNTRHYRQSIGKLTEAIETFNAQKLDFCVNLGDLIDKQWSSYDAISKPLANSLHPFHHVLGNHDFDLLDEYKARVPSRLRMPQRYYHFSLGLWKFVFLDTTDISLYAQGSDQPGYQEAEKQWKELKATGAKHAQTWNGAVGSQQLQWLKQTCESATTNQQRVIVFSHHPIFPENPHNVWNSPMLLDCIDRHSSIAAWFNGHNHAGNFGEYSHVPFITLQGMVETKDTNSYATLELSKDRLLLRGYGREPSREFRLRT